MVAVPHEKAAPLIPPGTLPEGTVAGWAWRASPIVNVHVIYDRPVTDLPFAAAIDSPVQWVFDRTRISAISASNHGRPGQQYLATSLSAADEYVDVPAATLREQFVPALAELFPAARDAQVTEFFVTRERRATFRQAPGSGALRPKAATRGPAWCWPAPGLPPDGREYAGAARSGLAAATELRHTVHTSTMGATSDCCNAGGRGPGPGFGRARAWSSAIARLTPDVRVVAAYHLGFADAAGNPASAAGRQGAAARAGPAVRPRRGRAARARRDRRGGGRARAQLLPAARRHHGQRHRARAPADGLDRVRRRAAILAGDALLALAQDLLLEDGHPQGAWAARGLSAAVQRLIGGQGSDLAFEKRDDVTLAECAGHGQRQTAALMACACSIGAVHLGAPPTLAMALAGVGAHVGLAFQLTDDLLGIWGVPEVTGKLVRADLRARKKSLPIVAALTAARPSGRTPRPAHQPGVADRGRPGSRGRPGGRGGRQGMGETEADAQLAAANASLADIDLAADVRAELTAIAEFITARQAEWTSPGKPSTELVITRSACSMPTAGGRANSRPTSPWTPRTCCCASSSACTTTR